MEPKKLSLQLPQFQECALGMTKTWVRTSLESKILDLVTEIMALLLNQSNGEIGQII